MKVKFYKFCYWLGCKLGNHRMEEWAYLHWFAPAGEAPDNFGFFAFSADYFKFCERWGIKAAVGE